MQNRNVLGKLTRCLPVMYTLTSIHELFLWVGRKNNLVELDFIGNQDLQRKENSEKT